MIKGRKYIFILCGLLLLFLLPGWRTFHYLIHPDHGKRHITFPFASDLSSPHIIDQHVVIGATDGSCAFSFDIKDKGHPEFKKGIPASGTVIGRPVFLDIYGYIPVKNGIVVVGMLQGKLSFYELIPVRGILTSIHVLEQKRRLFVLADDGLRSYDLSMPSRPVLISFDPSVRGGSKEQAKTPGITTAFCPLSDGRTVRVDSSNPSVVLFSDGKKMILSGKVLGLFEKNNRVQVLTEEKKLLDDNGTVIRENVEYYHVEKGISSWITRENGEEFFYQESHGQENFWCLPPELKGCRRFHAANHDFSAAWKNRVFFCSLNDETHKIHIVSSVPVVAQCDKTLALDDRMAYGATSESGNFLIYGIQYHRPPYDGTPYDFIFSYPSEFAGKTGSLSSETMLVVKNYLFAPDALIKFSLFSGPERICSLGQPPSSIHCDDPEEKYVVMTYDIPVNGKTAAVIYDISELPVLKKAGEIQDKNGFVDSILMGQYIWCLSSNGRVSCYDFTSGRKISEVEEKNGNFSTHRFLPVDKSCLYVFPSPESESKMLKIIDVRNEKMPFLLREVPDCIPFGTQDAVLIDHSLFVVEKSRIRRFDVSRPGDPVPEELFYGENIYDVPYLSLEVNGRTLVGKKKGSMDVWDNWERRNVINEK